MKCDVFLGMKPQSHAQLSIHGANRPASARDAMLPCTAAQTRAYLTLAFMVVVHTDPLIQICEEHQTVHRQVVRAAEQPARDKGYHDRDEQHDWNDDAHLTLQASRCLVVLQSQFNHR